MLPTLRLDGHQKSFTAYVEKLISRHLFFVAISPPSKRPWNFLIDHNTLKKQRRHTHKPCSNTDLYDQVPSLEAEPADRVGLSPTRLYVGCVRKRSP